MLACVCKCAYLELCQATRVGHRMGQVNISVSYSCFKDAFVVSKLTYTVKINLHFSATNDVLWVTRWFGRYGKNEGGEGMSNSIEKGP